VYKRQRLYPPWCGLTRRPSDVRVAMASLPFPVSRIPFRSPAFWSAYPSFPLESGWSA